MKLVVLICSLLHAQLLCIYIYLFNLSKPTNQSTDRPTDQLTNQANTYAYIQCKYVQLKLICSQSADVVHLQQNYM